MTDPEFMVAMAGMVGAGVAAFVKLRREMSSNYVPRSAYDADIGKVRDELTRCEDGRRSDDNKLGEMQRQNGEMQATILRLEARDEANNNEIQRLAGKLSVLIEVMGRRTNVD